MISTRSERARFIDGFVISFLAAACAATIALNIGLSVSPGKILPAALSMRTGDMSENIIEASWQALLDSVEFLLGEDSSQKST